MASGLPLSEVRRKATIDHIVVAARDHVLAHGIDATMEELAVATGVSRRTLFRLFSTRERLVASAFAAGMSMYVESIEPLSGDRDSWLRATCDALHHLNGFAGPGFFDLASRRDLSPDLAAAERNRRHVFRELMAHIAATLWRASGFDGSPPDHLQITITTHLSPFFTAAVITDAGRKWCDASELAFGAIAAALQEASPAASTR